MGARVNADAVNAVGSANDLEDAATTALADVTGGASRPGVAAGSWLGCLRMRRLASVCGADARSECGCYRRWIVELWRAAGDAESDDYRRSERRPGFQCGSARGGGDAGQATEDEIEGVGSAARWERTGVWGGDGAARWEGGVDVLAGGGAGVSGERAELLGGVWAGPGGSINTVSKSGTNGMHGAGFYLVRASAWGAANPYDVASNYVDGVVTSGVVKPDDLRQRFGGSVGGPLVPDRLFYFYTLDLLRRNYPAISSPQYAGFYTLTATQRALLGNRECRERRLLRR